MIGQPVGWNLVATADAYYLVPPEGTVLGAVRYRERVRPLRRLSELLEERMAGHRVFTSPRLIATEELITLEGEHAALVTLRGKIGDAPVQRDLGFVFGDDFYALIDAVCRNEARFAAFTAVVRDLVLTDSHALGVRRRRFRYTPPDDWQPVVRGFITEWIPAQFPREWANVTVYPANPISADRAADLEGLLARAAGHGFEVERQRGRHPIESASGLRGTTVEVVGRQRGHRALRAIAALVDHRFVYSMELVSRATDLWEGHLRELGIFYRSVQPVPSPGRHDAEARVVRFMVD